MSLRRRVEGLKGVRMAPQEPARRFPAGPTRLQLRELAQYIDHLETGGEPDEGLERKFGELANRPVSPEASAIERQIEAYESIDEGLY